jgi:hypothetical protein
VCKCYTMLVLEHEGTRVCSIEADLNVGGETTQVLFGRTVTQEELLLLDSLAPHYVLLLQCLVSLRDIDRSHILVHIVYTCDTLDCRICQCLCLIE